MIRKALRPEHIWLLLGATLLVAICISAFTYVVARHHWATTLMSDLEPRYARLAGLRADGARLRATDQSLSASLSRLAYGPEGDAAQAGNATLQQLRTAITARGLQVSSSQVLPAREEGDFLRIGLNLRVDGELPALRDFLRDMAQIQSPAIYSESVQLSAQPTRQGTQNVSAQLNLFVLKVRP